MFYLSPRKNLGGILKAHCPCVSSRFVSGAYLIYSLKKESDTCCVNASWDGRVCLAYHFWVTNSDLAFRLIVYLSVPLCVQCTSLERHGSAYHYWVTDLVFTIIVCLFV